MIKLNGRLDQEKIFTEFLFLEAFCVINGEDFIMIIDRGCIWG